MTISPKIRQLPDFTSPHTLYTVYIVAKAVTEQAVDASSAGKKEWRQAMQVAVTRKWFMDTHITTSVRRRLNSIHERAKRPVTMVNKRFYPAHDVRWEADRFTIGRLLSSWER